MCALTLRTRRHDPRFAGFIQGMLVREPVHGMQVLLEKQGLKTLRKTTAS
jgi:hypothetical protein